MKIFKPKSVLQLVVVGFVFVLAPVMFTVFKASMSLDGIADQNQANLNRAVMVTRTSQEAVNLTRDLERSLRQYQLLGKPEMIAIAKTQLSQLSQVIRQLKSGFSSKLIASRIQPFEEIGSLIRRRTDEIQKGSDITASDISLLKSFQGAADHLMSSSYLLTDGIIAETARLAAEFKQDIILKSLMVIPITLLLVLGFSFLIIKPVRQLHGAIEIIGAGKFAKNFEVSGPKELESLGDKLNWLGSRLTELEQDKQRFLEHISHELKTPLAAMKEGGELLADEVPGPLTVSQREVVDIINRNIKVFQHCIESLLNYNLLRSHRNLTKEDVSISDLVDDVVGTHKLTIARKQLNIKSDGPDMRTMLDPRLMKVAIDNLISNALSFSPEKTLVHIKWFDDAKKLYIEVRDEGPGVSDSELKSIFDPFFQGKARRTGPIKGSGLGLSLAQECVEAHDGFIKVLRQKCEDVKGACFQICLPLSTDGRVS